MRIELAYPVSATLFKIHSPIVPIHSFETGETAASAKPHRLQSPEQHFPPPHNHHRQDPDRHGPRLYRLVHRAPPTGPLVQHRQPPLGRKPASGHRGAASQTPVRQTHRSSFPLGSGRGRRGPTRRRGQQVRRADCGRNASAHYQQRARQHPLVPAAQARGCSGGAARHG